MSIAATIGTMGLASLACVAVEKVLYECGKQNQAQYISLFTSSTIGLMAMASAYKLIEFVMQMG